MALPLEKDVHEHNQTIKSCHEIRKKQHLCCDATLSVSLCKIRMSLENIF